MPSIPELGTSLTRNLDEGDRRLCIPFLGMKDKKEWCEIGKLSGTKRIQQR